MPRRLLPWTLALAAVAGAAHAAEAPPAASAAAIQSLTEAGKVDEAIDKGRAAIGQHPDDVDLRLAVAKALAAKGRRLNHVVNVKITQKDIDNGQIPLPAAGLNDTPLQVGYDSALFEEAILDLDEGIKRQKDRADVRAFKCYLLTDASRTDRAKAAIEDALAALPKTPETAKTMATYAAERTKRGDPEGGATLLAPVAAAFPQDAAVQADYGNILTRLGKKPEADQAFDRAVAIAPKDVRFARMRALAAMLLRDYPRAQKAFGDVFVLGRGPQDQFASAVAAYGVDPKTSIPLMRELAMPAASADPNATELANAFAVTATAGPASPASMSLAHRLIDGKQLVLAIPVLDRAIQANPKLTDARPMLAKVYTDLGCPALGKPFASAKPDAKAPAKAAPKAAPKPATKPATKPAS